MIAYSLYITLLLLIFLAAGAWAYYKERRHNNKKGGLVVLLVILLIIACNRYMPVVYTITQCGSFKKEVMVLPKTVSTIMLSYGNHCYINNLSGKDLVLQSIAYGSVTDTNFSTIIPPAACKQVPAHSLNYLFKKPPSSITINSSQSGAMKYWLDCADGNTDQ